MCIHIWHVYIYILIYIYIFANAYIYIYITCHAVSHLYIYTYIQVYKHLYIYYIYIYMHTYAFGSLCMCIYIYTYIHIYRERYIERDMHALGPLFYDSLRLAPLHKCSSSSGMRLQDCSMQRGKNTVCVCVAQSSIVLPHHNPFLSVRYACLFMWTVSCLGSSPSDPPGLPFIEAS